MEKRNDLMRCDVRESAEAYTLEIDLPGCGRDKIQAYVEDGYLKVAADLRRDSEARTLRRERFSGQCQRSFYVGEEIETEDIRASYRDGVLTLIVPKAAYDKHRNAGKVVID